MPNIALNALEFRILTEIEDVVAPYGLRVSAKMRLQDVIPIRNSGISDEWFRFGVASHFDFVVLDGQSCVLAVELDGPHHAEPDQMRRDRIKNALSTRFKLPLIRIGGKDLAECPMLGIERWADLHYASRLVSQVERSDSVVSDWRGKVVLPLICGLVLLVVVVAVVGFSGSDRRKDPAPVVQVPAPIVVIQQLPAKDLPPAKGLGVELATAAQMKYLLGLSAKKGWSDAEVLRQIQMVLGRKKSLGEVTKPEASRLIEAWKN
jgi:Protein of unknown function (DUF2726)